VTSGERLLVGGFGALAVASAGLLAVLLFGVDPATTGGGGGPSSAGAAAGGSAEPDGPPRIESLEAEEETGEPIDPERFAALIAELRHAIMTEEVERAHALVAANPGLLSAAIPMLVALLEDKAPTEKAKILTINLMKQVPTAEVRAAFRRALERELSPGIRKALLMAIGELKDVEAIPIVARIMLDEAEMMEIRRIAADTLGWIGHPDATPHLLQLIEILKYRLVSDGEKSLMSHALQALSLIKDRRATPVLLALLKDPQSSDWLVWLLVRAMGGIGDPAVTEALLDLARSAALEGTYAKSTRLDAIRSLFSVATAGSDAAAKGIIELFQTMEDQTFKKEALHNLAKLADNQAVLKELNTVLDATEEFAYRDLAVRGLAYKGGPDSFGRVFESLASDSNLDAKDILTKVGQQLLRAGDDEATKQKFRDHFIGALKATDDPRMLEGLFEGMGITEDPALGNAILERVQALDNEELAEKGMYAIARSRPASALPYFESTILDKEKSGQIRYAALESLRWYDSPAAVEALEHIRDTMTEPEDQVFRGQVEGAINLIRQRLEQKPKKSGSRRN